MNYDAFFFDFDGVLVDSVEVKTKAFAKLFETFGDDVVTQVVNHHRHHGGMTRVEKFRFYHRNFLKRDLDDEELDKLCHRFAQLVVDEVIAAPEIRGAEVFLQQYSQHIPCFVISATPEDEIKLIVKGRGWSDYFKEVRGAPESKENNLEKLLKYYRLMASQCLYFGDAHHDYVAATKWGVNFLGIVPGPKAPLLKVAQSIKWTTNFLNVNL